MNQRPSGERHRQSTYRQTNNAYSRLALLSDEQKDQVHQYALRNLSNTGVRVDSPLFPHWSMEMWQLVGQPAADKILRERTMQLMREAPAPPDHDFLKARGKAFINELSFGPR